MSNIPDAPEWLESLAVLTLQPGDVLLLRSKHRVSQEAIAYIESRVEDILPGIKVMVVEECDVGVLRRAA